MIYMNMHPATYTFVDKFCSEDMFTDIYIITQNLHMCTIPSFMFLKHLQNLFTLKIPLRTYKYSHCHLNNSKGEYTDIGWHTYLWINRWVKYPTEWKRNKMWKQICWSVYIFMMTFHSVWASSDNESENFLGKIFQMLQQSMRFSWQCNKEFQLLWNFKMRKEKNLYICIYIYTHLLSHTNT